MRSVENATEVCCMYASHLPGDSLEIGHAKCCSMMQEFARSDYVGLKLCNSRVVYPGSTLAGGRYQWIHEPHAEDARTLGAA